MCAKYETHLSNVELLTSFVAVGDRDGAGPRGRRENADSWARDLSDVSMHITIMVLGDRERRPGPREEEGGGWLGIPYFRLNLAFWGGRNFAPEVSKVTENVECGCNCNWQNIGRASCA